MTQTSAPAVALTGLHKRYGAVQAVSALDLRIERREVVALLGPNGAGKTTTLDMMLGLTRPNAGEVEIFGRPIETALADGLVGAVLQEADPLDGVTVSELVSAVAALYSAPMAVPDALAAAGVTDLAGRRTDRLSGGQRQRVRFAVAIVGDPDLLVLDEPTSAMDVASRRAFWESVRAYAADGNTVLFSTHYLEEADEIADRIVLIAGGSVVADGPVTQIKAVTSVKTVRATLDVPASAELARLPGVDAVEVHGQVATLRCADADTALRALLAHDPSARDLEVRAAPLADAVLQLTGAPDDPATQPTEPVADPAGGGR